MFRQSRFEKTCAQTLNTCRGSPFDSARGTPEAKVTEVRPRRWPRKWVIRYKEHTMCNDAPPKQGLCSNVFGPRPVSNQRAPATGRTMPPMSARRPELLLNSLLLSSPAVNSGRIAATHEQRRTRPECGTECRRRTPPYNRANRQCGEEMTSQSILTLNCCRNCSYASETCNVLDLPSVLSTQADRAAVRIRCPHTMTRMGNIATRCVGL